MNEPILKAVAMPPRLFWAPMAPALANMAIQFAAIFVMLGIYQANPLWIVLTTFFPAHIILIIAGTHEPHMSNVLKAQGQLTLNNYKAIYRNSGKKLAP